MTNGATYTNRYGDVHTFTLMDDGNILWQGNFEHHRVSWRNDYTAAYNKYVADGGKLPFNDFKQAVHEWDDDKQQYVFDACYRYLVVSDRSNISFVDPSGGPMISIGTRMGHFDPQFQSMVVQKLVPCEEGYKIIVK